MLYRTDSVDDAVHRTGAPNRLDIQCPSRACHDRRALTFLLYGLLAVLVIGILFVAAVYFLPRGEQLATPAPDSRTWAQLPRGRIRPDDVTANTAAGCVAGLSVRRDGPAPRPAHRRATGPGRGNRATAQRSKCGAGAACGRFECPEWSGSGRPDGAAGPAGKQANGGGARRGPGPVTTPTSQTRMIADDRVRCGWATSAPEYLAYHDDEWGRPLRRRPPAVRAVVPRGLPVGPVVADDPAKATRIPRGVRRLRHCRCRPIRGRRRAPPAG